MNAQQIKEAVRAGKTVCCGHEGYVVTLHVFKDKSEQWLIKCTMNNYCIGLTWQDGITLNGKEEDFYILEA